MIISEFILKAAGYQHIDIVKKYNKYPDFKKQIHKIQKDYQESLNMSIYSDLQQFQSKQIIQAVQSKAQKHEVGLYINFYAFKVDFDEDADDKFFLTFIRILDQKLRINPEKRYSIIYYHCLSDSSFPFSFLNETFKRLPLFYYAMLDKIYVVEPNFLVKNAVGMFDFGRLHKLFSKRIVYVDNLYQMGKVEQIAKSEVLTALPQILKHQKTLKQEKKAIKSGALQNIQNTSSKLQLKPANNQIILKSVQKQDYLTIPLQNHKLNGQGLPIALLILLQTFKKRVQFLKLEGIFRKSGSIEQEDDIINELSKMSTVTSLTSIDQHSGYAVASVVKKFFTKLTIPIIPYEIYNEIMLVQSIQEGKQIEFVRSIVTKLPHLNQKVLVNLIVFLRDNVISRKQVNKMNNYNMSVCFCPCLFRAKQATLEDLMNSGKYAKILDILFSKFDQIFPKDEIRLFTGKQNRGSKGSKGSRGSRNSKQNRTSSNADSPTKISI